VAPSLERSQSAGFVCFHKAAYPTTSAARMVASWRSIAPPWLARHQESID
jgi:hypothetical protein